MRPLACLTLASLVAAPLRAAADDVFVTRDPADVPLAVAPLVVAVAPEIGGAAAEGPACPERCDPSRIPAFDRWVLGASSPLAARLSDVLLVSLPVAALALDAADVRDRSFWTDGVLVVQALGLGALSVELAKLSTGRVRPWVYGAPVVPTEADARRSFFSGHTTLSFAAAVTYAEIYRRRHAGEAAVPFVWGSCAALAATVGLLRILAGKHFPSDVLVGAIVGTALGILVPAAHAR